MSLISTGRPDETAWNTGERIDFCSGFWLRAQSMNSGLMLESPQAMVRLPSGVSSEIVTHSHAGSPATRWQIRFIVSPRGRKSLRSRAISAIARRLSN
jgi:hypothetical protein